jgi:hypothetical protein
MPRFDPDEPGPLPGCCTQLAPVKGGPVGGAAEGGGDGLHHVGAGFCQLALPATVAASRWWPSVMTRHHP